MCLPIKVQRPDLLLKEGKTANGFEYAITYNDLGYRCGYLKLLPGHPWYGKEYVEIEASVHGGLTFAEPDKPCSKEGADDGYWIGFDCGHAYDAPDPALGKDSWHQNIFVYSGTIRTTEYVHGEIENLAAQAFAVTN